MKSNYRNEDQEEKPINKNAGYYAKKGLAAVGVAGSLVVSVIIGAGGCVVGAISALIALFAGSNGEESAAAKLTVDTFRAAGFVVKKAVDNYKNVGKPDLPKEQKNAKSKTSQVKASSRSQNSSKEYSGNLAPDLSTPRKATKLQEYSGHYR